MRLKKILKHYCIKENRFWREFVSKVTFSLGLGLVKMKLEPEKSWMRAGRVEGLDANQRARSDLYATLSWEKRSEAICWSSGERCGSFVAVDRNDRMASVVDITSPAGFAGSPFIFVFCSNYRKKYGIKRRWTK